MTTPKNNTKHNHFNTKHNHLNTKHNHLNSNNNNNYCCVFNTPQLVLNQFTTNIVWVTYGLQEQ
jgi:hypothetical protein